MHHKIVQIFNMMKNLDSKEKEGHLGTHSLGNYRLTICIFRKSWTQLERWENQGLISVEI